MAKKPEKLPFIIKKGCLEPADGYTVKRLRERGYNIGDTLMAILTKPRNPKFHRLAHQLGTLCVQNIKGFENLSEHNALKRLQWESGAGCDEIGAIIPNVGLTQIRIPKSLSYESMDEGEFKETIVAICRYIADHYWPDMKPDQVERLAEIMPTD